MGRIICFIFGHDWTGPYITDIGLVRDCPMCDRREVLTIGQSWKRVKK